MLVLAYISFKNQILYSTLWKFQNTFLLKNERGKEKGKRKGKREGRGKREGKGREGKGRKRKKRYTLGSLINMRF